MGWRLAILVGHAQDNVTVALFLDAPAATVFQFDGWIARLERVYQLPALYTLFHLAKVLGGFRFRSFFPRLVYATIFVRVPLAHCFALACLPFDFTPVGFLAF